MTVTDTLITADADLMTLVNVFTVAPDRQQELIDILAEAGDVMTGLRGFMSADLHRSDDGLRVVDYVQWRSRDDFQAMLSDPQAAPHTRRAAELATYDPIVCQVVHSTNA